MKKKGNIEFIYLFIILVIYCISMRTYYSYYINYNKIKNIQNESISLNYSIKNLSRYIFEALKNENYSSFVVDGYNIDIYNITNNSVPIYEDENGNILEKKCRIDYEDSQIIDTNDVKKFEKDKNYSNLFISFKNSDIEVSYNDITTAYNLKNDDSILNCKIEDKKDFEEYNQTLYFNNLKEETRIFNYKFINNPNNCNFFVVSITKNENVYYNIYMETKTSIKEIYSLY